MNQFLVACHECDLLQTLPSHSRNEAKFHCKRCGAPFHGQGRSDHTTALALMVTTLILFAVANLYPIISIESAGMERSATIVGAVKSLWQEKMQFVSALVLVTTLLAPAIEMTTMTIILSCIRFRWRPKGLHFLMRLAVSSRPWSMLEVFVLGVLVSVVKLSHLAHIAPGPALWCYGGLIIVFAAALANVDGHALWEEMESRA